MTWPGALVFDLDGTLVDSRGDIVVALNHGLRAMGRAALPALTIERFVGDGARSLCARATGLAENDPGVDAVLETFLAYYTAHPVDQTRWMPGALEVLREMSAFPLALCTNKPRRTTDAVLAALGVADKFAVIMAGGDMPEKKPDPAPLFAIASRLGLAPAQLVMIGDGPQDVEAGRAAGARTIGVLGGFLPDRLAASRPDVLVGSLAEVPAIVTSWCETTVRITVPPK